MLYRLELLSWGAADGALLRGLDTLQLLTARGADHRYGHRRMRGFAVLGFYSLSGVLGEVRDGDLACYDVLHSSSRPGERVLDERKVYVYRATLAGELLGHLARDVPHEAFGGAVQACYGVVGPGELSGAAFGDSGACLLEGAVVDGTFGARCLLDLLLGVGDRTAATLYLGGFTTRLLAVLLFDVLAGDRGVALLEGALLDARLDAAPLLPLFERVDEGRCLVGPVQLAAVVDLGEVQVLVPCGRGYLGVNGVEVGGTRAADGALRGLALGHVAADVALEAVLALGGAPDLVLNLSADALDVALVLALAEAAATSLEDLLLRSRVARVRAVVVAVGPVGLLGGTCVEVLEEGVYGLVFTHCLGRAHLVSDGAHRLHGAGGEDALYDLVDDARGYDRVALLDGVTDDGPCRHADDEAWDTVEPLQGLLRPRHVLFRGVEVGGLVLVVGYEDVRRQIAHHVLGVAADVHLVVGVVADAAHHDHRGVYLVYVLQRLLERLAGEERRLEVYAFVLGDLPGDLQVGRVDLGEPRVDDLLVQLLLLLEPEDLLGLGREHACYGVEHRVVKIRVEDRDSLDGSIELPCKLYRALQTAERLGRAVHGDDDVLEGRAVEVLDDQGVCLLEAPDDAFGYGAEYGVLDGGHAHRAHYDEVEVVLVDVLDDDLEVLAFERAPDELDVVLLAEGLQHVDIGVGDDLKALGDELVVDLALALHLVLITELLGEPALHLTKADVVHLRRVGMTTGDRAPEPPRHVDPDDARLIRVVRVVDRDVDLFVHKPRSPSFAGRQEVCSSSHAKNGDSLHLRSLPFSPKHRR